MQAGAGSKPDCVQQIILKLHKIERSSSFASPDQFQRGIVMDLKIVFDSDGALSIVCSNKTKK